MDSFGTLTYLQSSYETKTAKILNDLEINWIKPGALPYILEGKTKKYYPDFLLTDYKIYLDPKIPG